MISVIVVGVVLVVAVGVGIYLNKKESVKSESIPSVVVSTSPVIPPVIISKPGEVKPEDVKSDVKVDHKDEHKDEKK